MFSQRRRRLEFSDKNRRRLSRSAYTSIGALSQLSFSFFSLNYFVLQFLLSIVSCTFHTFIFMYLLYFPFSSIFLFSDFSQPLHGWSRFPLFMPCVPDVLFVIVVVVHRHYSLQLVICYLLCSYKPSPTQVWSVSLWIRISDIHIQQFNGDRSYSCFLLLFYNIL